MKMSSFRSLYLLPLAFGAGCGVNSTSSGSSTAAATGNTQYVSAYKAAAWGTTTTVTFPSTCEMTVVASGKPNYTPSAYYLAPAGTGQTIVAYTSSTNTALAVVPYSQIAASLQGATVTVDICPAKAASATSTSGGAIGYLISGTALFNPFEMNGTTPAVADNASYTFTDSNNTVQTASFLDQCNSHSSGTTWHAHGVPNCVTSQVDTATGPSHIIGFAFDGFPIYGGRDVNGTVITLSELDSCNGITSATPEFPSGVYHYVLPIGVTTKYASINCFTGAVNETSAALAKRLACKMQSMVAMNAASPAQEPAKHQEAHIPMSASI
jgi:hypothetical protein